MVRISKQSNIHILIKNKDSTVDNFKKLYEIAPEKFELSPDSDDNIIKVAEREGRNDLVEYFKTLNTKIQYTEEYFANKMILPAKKVHEIIQDINLKELSKEIQETIINTVVNKTRGFEETLEKLYYIFNNPKGGLDINIKYKNVDNNSISPAFFEFAKSDNVEGFKLLIQKFHPNFKLKDSFGNTILYYAISHKKIKAAKLIINTASETGFDINEKINGYTYLKYLYGYLLYYIQEEPVVDLIKTLIKKGLNVDSVITERNYTFLFITIQNDNKELFDFFLENGANVNHVTTNFATPLGTALNARSDIYYSEKLIQKGADVNMTFTIDKISYLYFLVKHKLSIDKIKLLIDAGANKNYKEPKENITALEYALKEYENDKEYFTKVIELLGGEIPKPKMWSGFTRSDIEKFDIFFEKPYDWSCCPICLEYVERSDGCMFMSHNCAKTNHYYNKKLYEKFAYELYFGAGKKVEWCTVCGRITENHKHFKLTRAQEPLKEKALMNAEVQARLARGDNQAFFDNANCIGFGGGGTEEKAIRFRRLREYALEVQEDIDKKKYEEVMDELIEEVWNAPLVRNRKIKKILEDKRWNINIMEFPENKRNSIKNNNANASNVPYNGILPTIVEDHCIIMGEDDDANTVETNPKIYFHHETIGGLDHNGIYICQKDLSKAIEIKCAEFGLEDFGKCWWPNCKAILHPEELKNKIPEVLYNDYKKKFNKKMAKKNGGGRKTRKLKSFFRKNKHSVLYELKDGTCSPPNFTRDGRLRKL